MTTIGRRAFAQLVVSGALAHTLPAKLLRDGAVLAEGERLGDTPAPETDDPVEFEEVFEFTIPRSMSLHAGETLKIKMPIILTE